MTSTPTTETQSDNTHREDSNRDLLENYDPDASDTVVTECPGCDAVIVVFQSGTIAEPRSEPHPPGELTPLWDAAFKKHHCPAKPGSYACKNCDERYDEETSAAECCSGPYETHGHVHVDTPDQ